jgi:hypothetical protein
MYGTPEFGIIDTATAGDTVLVTGVANKIIIVTYYNLVVAGAVNILFRSGATPLCGEKVFQDIGSGMVSGEVKDGIFKTAVGESFIINITDPVQVGGEFKYVVV